MKERLLFNVIALSYNYNCYFIFECPCQVLCCGCSVLPACLPCLLDIACYCCNVTGSGWLLLLNILCYQPSSMYCIGRKANLIDSRRLHFIFFYFTT